MSRRLQVGVIAAAVLLGVPIEWAFLDYQPWYIVALDAVEFAVYVLVGVLLWSRRPADRTGPLLVLSGFLFIVSGIWALGTPLLITLGSMTQGWSDVIRFQVLFGYPGGRVRHRYDQISLLLGAILLVGHGTWLALAGVTELPGGIVLFHPSPEFAFANLQFRVIVALVLLMNAMLIFLVHWLRGSPAYRRVMGPVLVAGTMGAIGEIVWLLSTGVLDVPLFGPDARLPALVVSYVSEITMPVALAFGMLRTRAARGTVGDLVVDLSHGLPQGGLRTVLSRTLRDPTLDVYFRSTDGGWLDSSGGLVALPASSEVRATTILAGADGPMAALVHDPVLAAEPELVEAAVAAARLALENERLHAEVLSKLAEVRASRARIVEAGDAERRRVERNLHDGAQQRLVTLALALQQAQQQVGGNDPRVSATLESAADELRLALSELRELARGIHPAILTEEGLAAAAEAVAQRASLPVIVNDTGIGRLSPSVEAAGYYVVSEGLANVAKHARATQARVRLARDGAMLRVEVSDDGVGGATPGNGTGIRSLEDRVAALGGALTVTSPLGRGTTLVAELPCG
jgi:signal transduction histidine kinase